MRREVTDQQVLWAVRVLVFVHHDVAELVSVTGERGLRRFEQGDGLQQQVVEVECVRGSQRARVPLVHLRDLIVPEAQARVAN